MQSAESIFNSNRLSGRTTRMLLKAMVLAAEGRAVYVLCAHQASLEHTKDLLAKMYEKARRDVPGNIKFETWDTLRGHLDIENVRLRGAHPNCRLLVDHHFYEHHFGFALLGYHQWDRTSESQDWVETDWDIK